MPELPEVEITARRLDAALRGATIESALAPGINALKPFDPPLAALEGRQITSIQRRGKQFVIEVAGDLALLVHLMSAGRLQLYDKRAGPRDRTSRLLLRIADPTHPRELRLREFGTKQAAWVKLLRGAAAAAHDAARPARHRRHRPLVGRRDPLDRAAVAVQARRRSLRRRGARPARGDRDRPRRRHRALREGRRAADPGQAAAAAAGPPQGRRAVPALRHDDRAGPLRGLRHVLLPRRADAGQGAQGPAALAAAEVANATAAAAPQSR